MKGDYKDSFLFEGDEAEILPLVLLYRVNFNLKQNLPNRTKKNLAFRAEILRFYTCSSFSFKSLLNLVCKLSLLLSKGCSTTAMLPNWKIKMLRRFYYFFIKIGVASRVADPYSFYTDPEFLAEYLSGSGSKTNTDPDPGVLMTKNWRKKIYSWKKISFNFDFKKTTVYLSLGLRKGHPSYKRSLQLSKENIQHFKTWNFLIFFLLLWVIFALLDPDSEYGSGSTDLIESGSKSDPDTDPQPWWKVCKIWVNEDETGAIHQG